MNLFFRELRAYRNSTIIWIVSLCSLVASFLLMFPAFTGDIDTTRQIVTNLPVAVRSALDISLSNFFTIYGFTAYLFTFATLAGAVQAMNLGVGIMSKEISGKTVDFLLTKPICRLKIYVSKVLAAISLLIFTNIFFCAISYFVARLVSSDDFDSRLFLLILATFLLIQLFFLALGLLMSVVVSRIKSSISVSLPTVFAFFVIGMTGSIIGSQAIRYICPFKFYDLSYVIDNGRYEPVFLIIEFVFIAIALVAGYIIFSRQDIRASS